MLWRHVRVFRGLLRYDPSIIFNFWLYPPPILWLSLSSWGHFHQYSLYERGIPLRAKIFKHVPGGLTSPCSFKHPPRKVLFNIFKNKFHFTFMWQFFNLLWVSQNLRWILHFRQNQALLPILKLKRSFTCELMKILNFLS